MIAIDFAGQRGAPWNVYTAPSKHGPFNLVFAPHPRQMEFFLSKKPRVMFGGGRGGGKSEALVWKPTYTAYLVEGCQMICFRRTMGELRKTIIQRFMDMQSLDIYARCTEDAVTYHNGSKLWFGSADDEKAVRKMLSGEYLLIEFDEWSEWPFSWWKFAEGSNRWPVSKDVLGNPVVPQIVGATNPGGVGGSTLAALFGADGKGKRQAPGEDPELYTPDEYEFIQSLVGDNPAYSEDSPAGAAYRKMLASQPRRVQAAWIYGRWDGFEGQYFDCLDEAVTSIPEDVVLQLMRKQFWAPRWLAYDWGKVHHSYVSWNVLLDIGPYKVPVTYDEKLCKGLGEMALAEEISDQCYANGDVLEDSRNGPQSKIVKTYCSPEIFGDSNSRAYRMGNVFVSRGLPRPIPAMNKRSGKEPETNGWRLMEDLLRARREVDILGTRRMISAWLISSKCKHAWDSLPQATINPKHDGDVLSEGDSPHLDVNDGLRYAIASHISPKERPFEDILKEELGKIEVEGTGRFMKHKEMVKVEREKKPGVFFIGARPLGRRRR